MASTCSSKSLRASTTFFQVGCSSDCNQVSNTRQSASSHSLVSLRIASSLVWSTLRNTPSLCHLAVFTCLRSSAKFGFLLSAFNLDEHKDKRLLKVNYIRVLYIFQPTVSQHQRSWHFQVHQEDPASFDGWLISCTTN